MSDLLWGFIAGATLVIGSGFMLLVWSLPAINDGKSE